MGIEDAGSDAAIGPSCDETERLGVDVFKGNAEGDPETRVSEVGVAVRTDEEESSVDEPRVLRDTKEGGELQTASVKTTQKATYCHTYIVLEGVRSTVGALADVTPVRLINVGRGCGNTARGSVSAGMLLRSPSSGSNPSKAGISANTKPRFAITTLDSLNTTWLVWFRR